MWPFVPPGTELEVEPLGDRLPRVGEIVVGVREGRVVAHRVVRVEGWGAETRVVTRGDAHDAEDAPWPPAELVGVAHRAVLGPWSVRLDHPAAAALGRAVAIHPRATAALRRGLAQPAARLGRLAAVLAARAATAAGLVTVAVAPLGPADERALDRLLLLHGLDLAAAAERRGTTVARELLAGDTLGARLAGHLAGAVLPAGRIERGPAGRPVLLAHPLARGSVERPLIEAARTRGLGDPAPLVPPARWLRTLHRLSGVRW